MEDLNEKKKNIKSKIIEIESISNTFFNVSILTELDFIYDMITDLNLLSQISPKSQEYIKERKININESIKLMVKNVNLKIVTFSIENPEEKELQNEFKKINDKLKNRGDNFGI